MIRRVTALFACCFFVAVPASVVVEPFAPREGDAHTVRVVEPDGVVLSLDGVLWDLRALDRGGRLVEWKTTTVADAGLTLQANRHGGDLALCPAGGAPVDGCRLLDASRPIDQPTWIAGVDSGLRWESGLALGSTLRLGDRDVAIARDAEGRTVLRRATRTIGEGILLTAAGPAETLLLEIDEGDGLLRYAFVAANGRTRATVVGRPTADGIAVERFESLTEFVTRADDGMVIDYDTFSQRLSPGETGFLQYSRVGDITLSAVHPGWTGIPEMIAPDATNVDIQIDPDDPSTVVTLPEVWDFTALDTSVLTFRTFNSTRDEVAGAGCITNCSTRDQSANPPDGTWQAYLKIVTYDDLGAVYTEDFFALNDNDTGANPSIDVPFTDQDARNASDRTQVCFAGSAGGADRFLRFFRFSGADPASASMKVGDVWTSGNWSSCNDANGLRVTAASQCGDQCYPGCDIPQPRARGRLAGNAGFRTEVLEDGFVHVGPGNYLPSLLIRQETNLEAGLDFIAACVLGTTALRNFDFFWVNDTYGLLAGVSSPNDQTITGDDWSSNGNTTDGTDFTWGPFPPHEMSGEACLSGTRVSWALPEDGTNLDGEPGIADYGYVVAWGDAPDAATLADWDTNPNHSPLPGEAGFLAAPAGSEPTSYVIDSWGGASVRATVTTALRHTDPDLADVTTFRSGAFYQVLEDPARLDGATFRVGDAVAPFTELSGADVVLSWPAVAGASGYRVAVFDLDTDAEIPCPAAMDCTPEGPTTTHPSGTTAGNLAYRAFAVDPCGEDSPN